MYLSFQPFRLPAIYFPTFTVLIFIFDYEYLHFSVFLCCTMEEAETAFTRILGKRNGLGLINESVLVQEFLVGKEYVIDKVQNRESSCYLFSVLSLCLSVCLSLCHSISASPSYFISVTLFFSNTHIRFPSHSSPSFPLYSTLSFPPLFSLYFPLSFPPLFPLISFLISSLFPSLIFSTALGLQGWGS